MSLNLICRDAQVNSITRIIDHEDVAIWEMDLHVKYYELRWYEDNGNGNLGVTFGPGERTHGIYERPRDLPLIHAVIEGADGLWSLLAECRRYTARIVAWKVPSD